MGQDERDLCYGGLHAVSDRSKDVGRGIPPADPVQILRRLVGREPSIRQQARVVEVIRRFDLRPGDSIFVVVAILESYLHDVEMACLDVQRATRKVMIGAALTAVVSAAVVVTPLYVLDPHIRSVLGWRTSPSVESERQEAPLPMRAFLHATLDQMPDADVTRIATSSDAMAILQALPQASGDQLARIHQYMLQPLAAKAR